MTCLFPEVFVTHTTRVLRRFLAQNKSAPQSHGNKGDVGLTPVPDRRLTLKLMTHHHLEAADKRSRCRLLVVTRFGILPRSRLPSDVDVHDRGGWAATVFLIRMRRHVEAACTPNARGLRTTIELHILFPVETGPGNPRLAFRPQLFCCQAGALVSWLERFEGCLEQPITKVRDASFHQ